jgi:hypothetical protein
VVVVIDDILRFSRWVCEFEKSDVQCAITVNGPVLVFLPKKKQKNLHDRPTFGTTPIFTLLH